jgi:hypothetical protein
MVVGATNSGNLYLFVHFYFKTINKQGKSSVVSTLQHALKRVIVRTLNPKAVSSRTLFGDLDEASGEWRDGITVLLFRECCAPPE